MHRLADLHKQFAGGDFNQGAVVAALPNESSVQNWFAYELKRESREAFSIEREPHVADEKEPDLRLQAKASDARLPIEINVAESWSLRQLENALTIQLQGRYLRDPQSKWGILLLVRQTPRAHGWKDGDNGFLSIDQVVERLRSRAHEIAAADAGAAKMTVVLVDVSSKDVKPA